MGKFYHFLMVNVGCVSYLDEGEFRNAWMRMNLNGSPEDIKECFENIDTDNSGKIDLFEFINAIKTRAFDAYREYNDDSVTFNHEEIFTKELLSPIKFTLLIK